MTLRVYQDRSIIWMLTAVGIAKKPELMEFTDLSLVIGTNMGIHALVCIACVVHTPNIVVGKRVGFLLEQGFTYMICSDLALVRCPL